MNIIKDVSKDAQGSASLDTVLAVAGRSGIENGKALDIINWLKRNGSIIEYKHNMFSLV